MADRTPMVLKTDQVLGVFANVEASEAESLRRQLSEAGIAFAVDPEQARRLAEPGRRTFVFGERSAQRLRGVLANYDIVAEVVEGIVVTDRLYHLPVEQLLHLGEPGRHGTGVDYAKRGIGREHMPELIRMATDEELHTGPPSSPVVWAPVHAWWALAQLRAEEAIVPLLGLLRRVDEEDDDWVGEDLPRVFAEIGPSAIVPVAEYLADASHGEWARVEAAVSLGWIAQAHPETRAECVARLTAQLEHYAEQPDNLNAFLISPLLDLRAVEAASLIEKAFAANRVDEMAIGDWEDAQIELGLKSGREHPRRANEFTELGRQLREAVAPVAASPKVGRNDPCPCGSGKKFKKCCGR